eukprot:100847-Alexandrium_andersonii.AAC.2
MVSLWTLRGGASVLRFLPGLMYWNPSASIRCCSTTVLSFATLFVSVLHLERQVSRCCRTSCKFCVRFTMVCIIVSLSMCSQAKATKSEGAAGRGAGTTSVHMPEDDEDAAERAPDSRNAGNCAGTARATASSTPAHVSKGGHGPCTPMSRNTTNTSSMT